MLEWILNGTAVSVLISLVVSKMVIIVTTFHLTLSALAILCIASVVTTTISTLLWFGKYTHFRRLRQLPQRYEYMVFTLNCTPPMLKCQRGQG